MFAPEGCRGPRTSSAIVTALECIALLAFSGTAGAADPSGRARLFAALPDWTGIWELAGAERLPPPVPKLWGKPPYTRAAQQKYAPKGFPVAAARNLIEVFAFVAPRASGCQDGRSVASPGFPAIMEVPFSDSLFELL